MKKVLLLLIVSLCINLHAQETKLVIDNQNPGWLSSLISYPQQNTLEELIVTGFVNKADMDFINGIINNHNLKVLDLDAVNLAEAEYGDGVIWHDFIKINGDRSLQKICLPRNINNNIGGIIINNKGSIDSLVISTEDINNITLSLSLTVIYSRPPKYLILSEGVKNIPNYAFMTQQDFDEMYYSVEPAYNYSVTCPNTIKKIGGYAFPKRAQFEYPFTFPDSVEYIGSYPLKYDGISYWGYQNSWNCYSNMNISEKRFDFPKKLKVYNGLKQNAAVDNFVSDTIVVYSDCDTLYARLKANVAFFYNRTPVKYYSSNDYQINTLYVPEGCLSAYTNTYPYSEAINNKSRIRQIKEMITVKEISITGNKDECYVGEQLQLYASIYPSDALFKSCHWESSDTTIATVNKSGNVRGVRAGCVEIYAISDENESVKGVYSVNVLQHVEGIDIDIDSYTLNEIGESLELQATVLPEDASNKEIIWKSTNESVCVVSRGKVVSVGDGICVILATTVDGGYMATCTVKVDTSSSIQNVVDDISISKDGIFDLQGMRHRDLRPGINIVRLSNGLTKKIIVIK